MKQIIFEVDDEVIGKERPRFTRTGKPYTPIRTRLYEKKIRKAFIESGAEMIISPVHIDIEAIAGIQKSASKAVRARRLSGQELAIKKPDVDNIAKIVLDSLNGLAYPDDANVVSMRVIKGRYEEEPRLIVRVRETSPEEITETHRWLWNDDDV